jgi:hypothetical protein
MSIAIAGSILGAQAIGAGHPERLGLITRTGIVLNLIITGSLLLLGYVFSRSLIGFFTSDPAVIEISQRMLYIILWSTLMFGGATVFSGVMRASGTVLPPTILAISAILLVEVSTACGGRIRSRSRRCSFCRGASIGSSGGGGRSRGSSEQGFHRRDFLSGQFELENRQIFLHVSFGARARERHDFHLREIAKQDLFRVALILHRHQPHGFVGEQVRIRGERPEALVGDLLLAAEGAQIHVVIRFRVEPVLQHRRFHAARSMQRLQCLEAIAIADADLLHLAGVDELFHRVPHFERLLVARTGRVENERVDVVRSQVSQ